MVSPAFGLDADEARRRLAAIWGYCSGFNDPVSIEISTMVERGRWSTPTEIEEKRQ